MSQLKKYKEAPLYIKDLIAGYKREHEQQSKITSIPRVISCLILLYYWVSNKFEKCTRDLKVSDNGMIVRKESGDNHGAAAERNIVRCAPKYHSLLNKKITWEFLITHNDVSVLNSWYSIKAFFLGGDIQYKLSLVGAWVSYVDKFPMWRRIAGREALVIAGSNKLYICLDLKLRQIAVAIGDAPLHILYRDIVQNQNTHYQLAVSLSRISEGIELINVEIE